MRACVSDFGVLGRLEAEPNPFAMESNAFKRFVEDVHIEDDDAELAGAGSCETAFVAACHSNPKC